MYSRDVFSYVVFLCSGLFSVVVIFIILIFLLLLFSRRFGGRHHSTYSSLLLYPHPRHVPFVTL